MRAQPVIAIDGPVGAGKSTVAREAARVLGFSYVNTGAMYRVLALAAREAGLDPELADIEARLQPILRSLTVHFEGEKVFSGQREVTGSLAEPQIGDWASRLSTLGTVRARMRELQRQAGEGGGVVMEGRDIGTAIFPDAEFKFFLNAAVEVRAARRFAELKAKGAAARPEDVLAQLIERDRRDSSRELAPLRCAADAIVIDSSQLTIPQVVERIKNQVKGSVREQGRA